MHCVTCVDCAHIKVVSSEYLFPSPQVYEISYMYEVPIESKTRIKLGREDETPCTRAHVVRFARSCAQVSGHTCAQVRANYFVVVAVSIATICKIYCAQHALTRALASCFGLLNCRNLSCYCTQ